MHHTWSKCVFFHTKQRLRLSFWDLRPLKTCFGIKTDFGDTNQDKSPNPYVAKFQKWPRMLRNNPLEGPRGLISFANFLTPLGASRQVWFFTKKTGQACCLEASCREYMHGGYQLTFVYTFRLQVMFLRERMYTLMEHCKSF